MQRKCRGPENYTLLCCFFLPFWSRPGSPHYPPNRTSRAAVHLHLLPSPPRLFTTEPSFSSLWVIPFLSMKESLSSSTCLHVHTGGESLHTSKTQGKERENLANFTLVFFVTLPQMSGPALRHGGAVKQHSRHLPGSAQ